MKRKTATTGLLAMGIVIALATLGLVFGQGWTDTLTINGTVNTASVDADLIVKSWSDSEQAAGSKFVASCQVDNLAGDPEKVAIVINNAYPNYWCTVNLSLVNAGNMPISANLKVISSTGPIGDPDSTGVTITNTCPDSPGGPSIQMPIGERFDCSITLSVNKLAIEKQAYTATTQINVRQFDKPLVATGE